MFQRAAGAILALVLIALPGILLQPGLVVSVTTDDGHVLVCTRAGRGDRLMLTFTHSMFGGDVRETYRINSEGVLIRERMVTDNAAAAEYYATDGRTEQHADGFEVFSEPFSTEEMVIRVDTRGNHRFTVGQTTWNLADAVTEPTQARISTTHMHSPGSPSCTFTNATSGISPYKETFL